MPVRSLSSSVIIWPNASEITRDLKEWACTNALNHSGLLGVGYYGSYARGNWGVGSDLDVVLVVERSDKPVSRRNIDWDCGHLPVPVDLVVYTLDEWMALSESKRRYTRMLLEETEWVYRKGF